MSTKLPVSLKPEVIAYTTCKQQHKMMTSLPFSNTSSNRDGLRLSKKFHLKYNATGPFKRNLPLRYGLVLKGTRIIIANKKREDILKLIHKCHFGFNKCKMRAKETVYWPGINEQLEQLILNCQLCLKYSRSKDKTHPIQH